MASEMAVRPKDMQARKLIEKCDKDLRERKAGEEEWGNCIKGLVKCAILVLV